MSIVDDVGSSTVCVFVIIVKMVCLKRVANAAIIVVGLDLLLLAGVSVKAVSLRGGAGGAVEGPLKANPRPKFWPLSAKKKHC